MKHIEEAVISQQSREFSEVYEVLLTARLIPLQEPRPSLAEIVQKLIDAQHRDNQIVIQRTGDEQNMGRWDWDAKIKGKKYLGSGLSLAASVHDLKELLYSPDGPLGYDLP